MLNTKQKTENRKEKSVNQLRSIEHMDYLEGCETNTATTAFIVDVCVIFLCYLRISISTIHKNKNFLYVLQHVNK